MKTKIVKTDIEDLVIVEIDFFRDERGFFIEPWNQRDFQQARLDFTFVQEGHSGSQANVLRGLHYQNMTAPMGKLVSCIKGEVFDVAVDLRTKSKTFGKWYGTKLDDKDKKQLYVPIGFAHGFAVIGDWAEIHYKQTGYYNPDSEVVIAYNDQDLAIDWPIKNPILSDKDKKGISLKDYKKNPDFT